MQVEQALYGDCRGAHSLLSSSADNEVATAIAQRLDLPDTAPPSAAWSPFLRGFPYENKYVLSRTFLDTGASRGGMVFSHALLAPLDEMTETQDLRPLLNLLAGTDRQRPEATTAQVVRHEADVPRAFDLIDAAEALGASGRLPVVRISHIGFDSLVVALWAHLSSEIRRGFAFRLSFDPRDLVETPTPALVCTPQEMAGRWSEYSVLRSAKSREPGSLAAAILCGHKDATPVIEFMQDLGLKPRSFPDLRLVEQAYRLNTSEPTVEHRAAVVRLVEKLSPDSNVNKGGKDVLVRRLCEVISVARPDEILLLRNLQLTAFRPPSRVWRAIKGWMAESSFVQSQDVELLSVIKDATTSDAAVEEWQTAILDGLTIAAGSVKSSFPSAFWRWLAIHPEVVVAVFRHVPTDSETELRLANTVPRSLDEAAADIITTHAVSRGWLCLHGATLSATCSTSDAVHRQVAVDTDPAFSAGLQFALRRAKPVEVVRSALKIEDPRMLQLAGKAVAKNPRILADIDLSAIRAQAIWCNALAVNPESWAGPADPMAEFHSLLGVLLDGGEADRLLIERLSGTQLADLGSYPRRAGVWSRVGGVAHKNLLTATADGWLKQSAGDEVPFIPDDDLQTIILSDHKLEQTLDALVPRRVGVAVRIIAALGQYEEKGFLRFLRRLDSRTTPLAAMAAEEIGRLALKRQWKDAAADLASQLKSGHQDLRPALRACCDMLDWWERFSLGLAPVSAGEKWKGFQDLAVKLYPGGPDDDGLWERAGGDGADLLVKGDGRTRWQKAMRDIRNGRGPIPSALFVEMMRDFPNNEQIPHLARDSVFGEGFSDGL